MASLLPETRAIIAEVELLSGRPVHVEEDASLSAHATVITARGSLPAHLVRYRPGAGPVDYLIAFQLGFLIRTFSMPPDQRFQVASTASEQKAAVRSLGLEVLEPEMAKWLLTNLIVQLRSCSVGMRVDDWIRSEFPALVPMQVESAKAQMVQNESTLAPEVRQKFPKTLIDANASMNAAYAAYWSRVLGDPRHSIPYRALGYDVAAGGLLGVVDRLPDAPNEDRSLIEGWGELLNLAGTFHIEPHRFD